MNKLNRRLCKIWEMGEWRSKGKLYSNVENKIRFDVPDSFLHTQHAQSGHDGAIRRANRRGRLHIRT